MSECASKGCGCTTEPIIQPTAPAPLATGSAQAVYRIENMDCPTEEALIRSKLAGLAGVAGLEFNLMQRTLAVRHELPSLSPVEQALKAIGMQAVRMDQASAEQTTKLSIAKMDCPTEEAMIRGKLAGMAGVDALDFNLVQRTLQVRHHPNALPDVLAALKSLGFDAEMRDVAAAASEATRRHDTLVARDFQVRGPGPIASQAHPGLQPKAAVGGACGSTRERRPPCCS